MMRSSRQRTGDRALERSRPGAAKPSRGSMVLAITPGHVYAFLFLALLTLASEPAYGNAQDIDEPQTTGVLIKVKIEGFRRVELATNEAGQPRYYITQADGGQGPYDEGKSVPRGGEDDRHAGSLRENFA